MLENKKITTDFKEKIEFFAAANSGRGFVSFYKEIFGAKAIERRYLIKGGPGTGKSTLMRRLADEAESRGMCVERYRCSSDASSLDGVIIEKRIAIIDSTAPHSEEAELVGARDTLVDLGRFWNSDRLFLERERIEALSQKKRSAYALAYRFLSAAMESDMASREMILPYVNKGRVARIAKRLTRSIASDGGFESKIGLNGAIGMNGRCTIDSYTAIARKTVYIEERYGIGYLALGEICEEARRKGCKIAISFEPLTPELPNAVLFEESKTLFALAKKGQRGVISLRRALDFTLLSSKDARELKFKSRGAGKISEALVDAATDELKRAGEAHFELEKIYRDAMNFVVLNEYTESLIGEILKCAEK